MIQRRHPAGERVGRLVGQRARHPEAEIVFSSGPALEPPQEESLAALAAVSAVKNLQGRDFSERLKELGKEVDLRIKGEGSKIPIFLLLYGIPDIFGLRGPALLQTVSVLPLALVCAGSPFIRSKFTEVNPASRRNAVAAATSP